jgi:hypothetical protein
MALTGVVTMSVQQSAEAAPRRVITACYSTETGKIRIVSSATACRSSEEHISWVRGGKGVAKLRGPKGAKGSTGAQGNVGPAGPVGPRGATGAQGDAGPAGAAGSAGPAGVAGAAGAAGVAGPAGVAGTPGPAGPAGATGANGATGPTGATGATGSAVSSYGYGRAINASNVSPGGTNTVVFTTQTSSSDVVVNATDITVSNPGVYEVTFSVRSESVNTAIWWVDTASDYTLHPGSQLSLPAAASPSAAITSSVTFVTPASAGTVFRPRYVSGTTANFRDVQLTVRRIGDAV